VQNLLIMHMKSRTVPKIRQVGFQAGDNCGDELLFGHGRIFAEEIDPIRGGVAL